jgi:hypothetical protein
MKGYFTTGQRSTKRIRPELANTVQERGDIPSLIRSGFHDFTSS